MRDRLPFAEKWWRNGAFDFKMSAVGQAEASSAEEQLAKE
jgi:hypothetical protein